MTRVPTASASRCCAGCRWRDAVRARLGRRERDGDGRSGKRGGHGLSDLFYSNCIPSVFLKGLAPAPSLLPSLPPAAAASPARRTADVLRLVPWGQRALASCHVHFTWDVKRKEGARHRKRTGNANRKTAAEKRGKGGDTLNFMRFIVLRSCFCMCTLPMLWPMPLDSLFFCFPPIISLFCLGTCRRLCVHLGVTFLFGKEGRPSDDPNVIPLPRQSIPVT